VYVSVFACLFVRQFAYLKKSLSNFHEIFFTCYLWSWLRHPSMIVEFVMYFRFCGTTSCFLIMEPVDQNRIQRYASSNSPGGGIGGEVAV